MTLRNFLVFLGVAGLCSWGAWVTVLVYIDPTASGTIGIAVFYVALFLALLATFTLCGVLGRVLARVYRKESYVVFRFLVPAVRQSVWLSLLAVISLWLLAAELFSIWAVTALLLGFILLEAFYLSRVPENNNETN
ncbi:MAG: hypothetical protein ACD_43C00151G0002 [uncultured bacterium]|nr:MAG: hypothetical protein ACD_43C00151G0002 [uncultured bacterium]